MKPDAIERQLGHAELDDVRRAYDTRRALVLEEANAIGTVYQRASLIDEPFRSALVAPLRDYTHTRIAFYEAGDDDAKFAVIERQTNGIVC